VKSGSPGCLIQQERFCRRWRSAPPFSLVRPGDLIFFGRPQYAAPMWGCIWAKAASAQLRRPSNGTTGLAVDKLRTQSRSGCQATTGSELRGSRPGGALPMTAQPFPEQAGWRQRLPVGCRPPYLPKPWRNRSNSKLSVVHSPCTTRQGQCGVATGSASGRSGGRMGRKL